MYEGPLEDRIAIRELIETYADAVCMRDPAAWGATWAEDAVWELPEVPAVGTVTGRDKIVAVWQAAMEHYPGIVFVGNPGAITITGSEAVVRSYTSETFTDAAGRTHRMRGRYDDVCVKRGQKWMFKLRRFQLLHRDLT
jgi:uncharacterized protein (TIGR02246 family)